MRASGVIFPAQFAVVRALCLFDCNDVAFGLVRFAFAVGVSTGSGCGSPRHRRPEFFYTFRSPYRIHRACGIVGLVWFTLFTPLMLATVYESAAFLKQIREAHSFNEAL